MKHTVFIHPQERTDDLQLGNLRLIQNPKQFCFGIDAVLLSHYAAQFIKPKEKVLDLCSGNGIIPILLTAKSAAESISALEIQPDVAEMAERSVRLNGLESRVRILCGNVTESVQLFGKGQFDCITCNPPYKEAGSGLPNSADAMTVARHEIHCTLRDIIEASAQLLKPGGRLCMVHRPDRLADLLVLMRQFQVEPKRLRFVHPLPSKAANLILVEGRRNGRPKLFLDPPLYVYEKEGVYSTEINEIYGRKGDALS